MSNDQGPSIDRVTIRAARWLANRHSRRSFIGLLGRAAAIMAGAGAIEALELTAPSRKAFASHCNPGFHAGPACGSQSSCSANGLSTGQYWLSCCIGICGNCRSWKYVKFTDCCDGSGCGGKVGGNVYCPSPKCFQCKIQSCTSTHCTKTCDVLQ